MKFRDRIGIVDDSLRGVYLINEIENKIDANLIMISDTKNYPYGLRKSIKQLTQDLQKTIEKKYIDVLVVVNLEIALNIDKNKKYEIIDAIEILSCIDFNDKILSSKYVNNYLINKGYNTVNAQMLINSVDDISFDRDVIRELMVEYIGNSKKVFVVDSNLCILKNMFEEFFPDVEIYYISDFIIEKLKNRFVEETQTKTNYLVTEHRLGFCYKCQKVFDKDYVKVKYIEMGNYGR